MTNFILKYIENANTNIEAKIEQQEYVQQKLFIMTQTIKTSDFNIKYAIAYLTPYDQQLVKQKLITKLTPYFKEYFTKYGCVEEVSERIAEWLMNQESQSDKPKLIASNFANFFNDKKLQKTIKNNITKLTTDTQNQCKGILYLKVLSHITPSSLQNITSGAIDILKTELTQRFEEEYLAECFIECIKPFIHKFACFFIMRTAEDGHIDMADKFSDVNGCIEDIYKFKFDKSGKAAVTKMKSAINHFIELNHLNKNFFTSLSSKMVTFIEKHKAQQPNFIAMKTDIEIENGKSNSDIQSIQSDLYCDLTDIEDQIEVDLRDAGLLSEDNLPQSEKLPENITEQIRLILENQQHDLTNSDIDSDDEIMLTEAQDLELEKLVLKDVPQPEKMPENIAEQIRSTLENQQHNLTNSDIDSDDEIMLTEAEDLVLAEWVLEDIHQSEKMPENITEQIRLTLENQQHDLTNSDIDSDDEIMLTEAEDLELEKLVFEKLPNHEEIPDWI
ncbi:repeat-containing protein B [Orientia tsutsugamushi str. Ikeda]|uniref:Repeat-containing protein B n=1 Tax=Orientia tsutsugamushi (strain Ikeda) TaxID=334380 RepID=B3CQZ1_ORITI|nr:hypothetical protein [Orientia tsutsugamushi]BAG39898.1 repeat-containing protein B [Orientia tsutsugamushi str. Ikeda]